MRELKHFQMASCEITFNKGILIAFALWMMSGLTNATASPPACFRNDVSMYIYSDAVVEAIVKQSRRWSEAGSTLHLVAKYIITEVFKGDVHKDEILILTDTCLDEPIPQQMLGYPKVEDYCRGGIGLTLTGVDSKDGTPVKKSGEKPRVILFVKKNIQRGAPQLTWLEVSRTSFYGGCWQNRNDIPPDEREQFDRLQQRLQYTNSR